jgi:Ca2+-transporting ATPase
MDHLTGLTDAQAASALAVVGPNDLPRAAGRGVIGIVIDTMREPMFLLLIGAAGLYLTLSDLAEGLFLLAGALASIGLVVLQEARSERALAALRDMSEPFARVIRGGAERTVAARELVPGDLILTGEGQRLPADGALVAGDVLSVDESALTGESAPVSKRPLLATETYDPEAAPGAEAGPNLFRGTLIVRGQAVVRVGSTGARTALGRIGVSLAAIQEEPTPLQKTAGRLIALLGAMAIAFCGLVALAYGLLRQDWVGGVLAGITVAIALIPEEFPMVLAIFMALGAWRLATHKVLVRRSAVIEALGGATVLCVDKTGTLTENRMRVARLWSEGQAFPMGGHPPPSGGAAASLLRFAGLASAVRPVDPMDKAVREALSAGGKADQPGAVLERSWPLRPDLMAVVQVWIFPDGRREAAAKGAPEAIFRLCGLADAEVRRLEEVLAGLTGEGLRVLGVASRRIAGPCPEDPTTTPFEFSGLVAFLDPVREEVPSALREAREAGIAVVMITGDHPATALAIARQAGVDVTGGVLLGGDVAALSAESLREKLASVRVFARITPDQKLAIVRALSAEGHVVAMTGDGVNDAPALEAAQISIAMGQRGSDVAREAADLVLMDDSFGSIVGGVRLGRRIFSNLRRALVYVTAIHVPIAGVALAPVLLGLPPLLFPMHVVLMELAIDPICAMAFEGEPSSPNAMRRPPRRRDEPLFGAAQLRLALLQGGVVFAAVLGIYVWALGAYPETQARGAAFLTLVVGNLILALADSITTGGRLFARHRRVFWGIAAATLATLAVVLVAPEVARVFRVSMPAPVLLTVALLAAAASGGWFALVRRGRRRRD